ncbi:Probable DNA polymerase III%2C delta' subunit [Mycobacteroides abscessus]|nr:Probable DNA polymerase III%2C delta' subunit [Mycobacteroides abscessus]
MLSFGAAGQGRVALHHPDMADRLGPMVDRVPPEQLLKCIEAVLECREALAVNVKPKFAIDALVATAGQALRPSE